MHSRPANPEPRPYRGEQRLPSPDVTDSPIHDDRRALRYPANWPWFLNRLVSLAIVPGDSPVEIRTKRLFTAAIWASLFTSPISIVLLRDDAPLAAAVTGVPLLTAALALISMWARPAAYPGVMHLVAGGTIATASALMVMFGGIYESAGAASWALLAVFGAVAIFADRRAHLWFIVYALSTAVAGVLAARVDTLYQVPNPELLAVFDLGTVSLFGIGRLPVVGSRSGVEQNHLGGRRQPVLCDQLLVCG